MHWEMKRPDDTSVMVGRGGFGNTGSGIVWQAHLAIP
jgi:hypothetical protein